MHANKGNTGVAGAAQNAPAVPVLGTLDPIVKGQNRWFQCNHVLQLQILHRGNLRLEFGIVRAYFCSPSTSPHINQHHHSPLSLPWSRLSFALKQSHIKPHKQIHMCTQQDPEVRLSHCPYTHEVACQLRLSAVFAACFRSFYFRSVFPLCKWPHKHRLCLHCHFNIIYY